MRKILSFLALASASMMLTQSCNKMQMRDKPTTTTQAVSATITENASYTYTLPATTKDGLPQVSTSASHASTSNITVDANGNYVYNYTPAANYSGSDVVVIATKTAQQQGNCHGGPMGMGGNCNHGGNGCSHDDDNTTITTINLTVTPASQPVGTSQVNSATSND